MNNKENAQAYLKDAEIIIREAKTSFKLGHWHRVVRKCQETAELSVKGMLKYLGIEFPKSHILGRFIKRELSKFNLLTKDELNKLAFISDKLAFDREISFYGTLDGIPASEMFTKDDAKEAIKDVEWIVELLKSRIFKY